MAYLFECALLVDYFCVHFIVFGFILEEVIEFRVHRVFTSDVGLDSLYLLEYLLLVVGVVVIEVAIIGLNVGFEHIEHTISHVLALGMLRCFVDEMR
jgi:hypothetical protein